MRTSFFTELLNPTIKNLFTLRQKVIYVYAALVMVSCFVASISRLLSEQYFLVLVNGVVILSLCFAIFITKKGHITVAALLLSAIILVPAISVIHKDNSRIIDNGIYLALVPIVNLFLINDKRISFIIFLISTLFLSYFFEVAQMVFLPFLTIFSVHMVYFFFFSIHIDKLEKELISENKRKELLIEDLEIKNQEIEKLNLNLEKTNQVLQEKVEDIQQFAYLSSHNLQTTLYNIKNYSNLLKKQYAPQLDETGINSVHYLSESANTLSNILHGLVDYFSTFEQAKAQDIVLEDLITTILAEESALVNNKNVTIHYQQLPVIKGKHIEIKRLFQHIIQNALIHNPSIDPLNISIAANSLENTLQFSITDNGVGIPQKDLNKIFKIYVSSISFSKGMGLAIAKKIVSNYKGNIWVESTLGQGTTIHFTLKTTWYYSNNVIAN